MNNKLASFLGDPNFPSKLSNDATTRGEKIRVYENIYRQYTRLQFTHISDRPIAIAGLEKRLIRDLRAEGGYGVFDDGEAFRDEGHGTGGPGGPDGPGEKKNGAIDETVHFVLVVTRTKEPLKSKEGNTLYERVGVGRVKGKDLDLKSPPQAIVIR
ncbi:putative tol-like protein [Diaporthe ampelina]|uniref:Putative tol-like protein n=1 Tax=Diaporthe ampelina TaxID=1214573 RepID=A0A0G2FYA6_9PEZI|nr:putative tol-like protein [Diaporthe ampelina]